MSLRIGWAFLWTLGSLAATAGVAAEPASRSSSTGSLLDDATTQQRLITQQIQTEVEQQLLAAREQVASEPTTVRSRLKWLDERVRLTPELPATVRAQLRARIETTLRQATRLALEADERQAARQANQAQAEEQQLLAARLASNQQRVQQLMDRFNSLMLEERYQLANELAGEIRSLMPGSTLTASAESVGRLAQVRNYQAVQLARADGLAKTLGQTELSAVPYADDVPLTYPQAEVWRELSARRLAQYRAELSNESPAEKRIRQALDETTSMDFVDTPLQDVVDYLKDLHGIEIQLDTRALADAGIAPDLPVSRRLSGISLRSALKLLLSSVDLSYVIKNEVLIITTPEMAATDLVSRVYPMADLVVPIPPLGFSGGFGGLGGGSNGPGSFFNGGSTSQGNGAFNNPGGNNNGPGIF